RGMFDKMPAAGQTAVGKVVGDQMAALDDAAAKVMAIPGTEKLRPVVEAITAKLAGLNLAGISQQATTMLASLTQSLDSIKDKASAEKALPQLEKLSGQLDELAKVRQSMSPGGQSMLAKVIAGARASLDQIVSRVMTALGVDAAAIKPVVND